MMDSGKQQELKLLSFKLVAEASLKLKEVGLKTSAIIPFVVTMLETTLDVLIQAKATNPDLAKESPEDFVDSAIVQILTMFSQSFGREIETYLEKDRKSKEEISRQVDEFLKNLPKKGKE